MNEKLQEVVAELILGRPSVNRQQQRGLFRHCSALLLFAYGTLAIRPWCEQSFPIAKRERERVKRIFATFKYAEKSFIVQKDVIYKRRLIRSNERYEMKRITNFMKDNKWFRFVYLCFGKNKFRGNARFL